MMSSHPYPDYERKVVFLDTRRVVNAGPLACKPDRWDSIRERLSGPAHHVSTELAEQHRKARLQRELQRDLDHDLRIIGWGMAAAYFAVCIFRLSQMGVL